MATKRAAAPTGRVKVGTTGAPQVAQREVNGAPPEADAVAEDEEKVTVTIPEAFTLTLDNGVPVTYTAGIDEMPKSHAEHWYAKVRGVEIYVAE